MLFCAPQQDSHQLHFPVFFALVFPYFFVLFYLTSLYCFTMSDGRSSPPPPPLDPPSSSGGSSGTPPVPQTIHTQSEGQQAGFRLPLPSTSSSGVAVNPNHLHRLDSEAILQAMNFPFPNFSNNTPLVVPPRTSQQVPSFSAPSVGNPVPAAAPGAQGPAAHPLSSNAVVLGAITELASLVRTSSADTAQRLDQLERGTAIKKAAVDPESFKNKHSKNEVVTLNSIKEVAAQNSPGECSTALYDKLCALIDARIEVLRVGEVYGWDVAENCIWFCGSLAIFCVVYFRRFLTR